MSTPPMTLADLRSARSEGKRPSAPGADLRGADLDGANLDGADLRGADLRGASWGGLRIDGMPSVVRRLAPLECERLQGAPDGWTDIGQADSPRYRQLGNAVAVPVFEWVARRLVEVDAERAA